MFHGFLDIVSCPSKEGGYKKKLPLVIESMALSWWGSTPRTSKSQGNPIKEGFCCTTKPLSPMLRNELPIYNQTKVSWFHHVYHVCPSRFQCVNSHFWSFVGTKYCFRNIIQIHNNVMYDWHYSMKYSYNHTETWEILCGILLIPQKIVMNIVMSNICVLIVHMSFLGLHHTFIIVCLVSYNVGMIVWISPWCSLAK